MKEKTAGIIKRTARGLFSAGNAWRLLALLFALAVLLTMCHGARWATEQSGTGTELKP